MARELIKKGLSKPWRIPGFLLEKCLEVSVDPYRDIKSDIKYEFYRRRKQIPMQTEFIDNLVTENEEFVLIILDACRFDYFREEYENYLSGDLTKVWSAGNRTPKWTPNTWTREYDIDYIAGVSFPVTKDAYSGRKGDFSPGKVFEKTYHVTYRDDFFSSITADVITDVALYHLANSDKIRTVVHHGFPHEPYIGDTKILPWRIESNELIEKAEEFGFQNKIPESISNREFVAGEEILKYGLTEEERSNLDLEWWHTRNRLNNNITNDELRQAYRDNLRYVLEEVTRLVEYLDCKVVVSSDHGEHLGGHMNELPDYHHPDRTHPVLREVPWLVVDDKYESRRPLSEVDLSFDDIRGYLSDGTEEETRSHLRSLGYLN